jgi:hypothetical protein
MEHQPYQGSSALHGDEIAAKVAEKMGLEFIGRRSFMNWQ